MAYIGKTPTVGNFVKLDALTASATASYTMQVDSVNFSPESVNHMLVSLNGVIQSPTTSYTISGSTITFASALTSSDSIDFIMVYGNVLDIGTPSDATVTNAKTNFVSTSSAAGLQIKGDGTTDGTLQLNCSQNSHGVKIKSPAHSASASYTLTLPTTDGDADQVLKTNGSGVLDWTTASSGDFTRVASGAASSGDGAITVAGCFTSSYKIYKIFFYDWNGSNDHDPYLRWLTGTNTEQSASNSYQYAGVGFNTSGQNSAWSGSHSAFRIAGETLRHDSNEHFGWEGTLYNPLDTSLKARLVMSGGGRRTSNYGFSAHGTGEWDDLTPITGFKALPSTGTFDSCSFEVYGLTS